MKRFGTLLLALCLLLAGCAPAGNPTMPDEELSPFDLIEQPDGSAQPVPVDDLEALLALANQRHQAIQKPRLDLLDYVVEAGESDFDIFRYTVDWESWDYDGDLPLSPEAMEEDLGVLFEALRTTYGAYHYFGGETAFGAAEEAVRAGFLALEEDQQTCRALGLLLLEQLSFIQDAHFTLNGGRFHQPQVAFHYTGTAFDRSAGGGFVARDGRVLQSVEGWEDPGELLRLSLSEAGEVVYYPVVLHAPDGDNPQPEALTLHYADGSSETLEPQPWEDYYQESEQPVSLGDRDGVPVLFASSMGFDQSVQDYGQGREFLALAQELREEPVVILDLRFNIGGNGALPLKWLEIWCGQPVTTNSVGLQYWSEQDMLDFVAQTDNQYYSSLEDFTQVLAMTPITDDYMSIGDVPDLFAESERLLIVLTGKYTSSSGEQFVDAAMNVENVLVVGENTYGMLRSNAYTTMELPHSKLAVTLGCNLLLFPEDHFQEYVGFQPDLWTSGDALELTLLMLERYR